MFIGHYAVALGAKRVAPRLSLGTLVLASQLVDLLWPLFLLLGLEHVRIDPGNTVMTPLDFYDYPLTHSLLGALFWAVLLGALYMIARRRLREAIVLAGVSLSHWVLDFLTHRPDLPLVPGTATRVGLGLWNSVVGSLVVEVGLFVTGAWLYIRSTRAIDRLGTIALWTFLATLALIHAVNVLGPPPPSAQAVAYAGQLLWLFVLWAFWIDRHRRPAHRGAAAS